jgi:hypothetical protein
MTLRFATSALLALLAANAAFAQEGTQDFANQTLSTRSRDEVRRELAQARASGQLENRGETYGGFARHEVASVRSRVQVLAELDAARRAGELENRNQSYGSFARNEIFSTKTRAEVLAEVTQVQAAGVRLSQGERAVVR